jgi:ribosomal protein S18 acetylase RimI-like enzyme
LGRRAMITGNVQHLLGNLTVRRLRETDVELFRAVRLAALRDSPDAFGETLEGAQQSDWQRRTVDGSVFSDRAVYLAVADGMPVGMVFVKCAAPAEHAFLGGMWVQPEFRRRGAGRLLVESALDFLRSAGQRQLSVWVTGGHTDVLKFYRTLGFQDTGATSTLRPGSDVAICELSLVLT